MMDWWKAFRAVLFIILLAVLLHLGKIFFGEIYLIREPTYSAELAINFGSMVVGCCLIGALLFDHHYGPYNRVSALILAGIVIVMMMDSVGLYCWMVEGNERYTFVFFNLEYYFVCMSLYAMMVALGEYIDPDPKTFRLMLAIGFIPVLFESTLLTQNIFTHNVWYMDGIDLVHGPYYPLMFMSPMLLDIMYIFTSIVLAKSRRVGTIFASFMIASILSVVIMLPNYYPTLNYAATLFPMILVIPYEYNRRGKEIAECERAIEERNDAMKVAQLNIREIESTLIHIENHRDVPDSVSEALGKFRKFISENYESFNNPSMIPFGKELEYTKVYLYLEKLRYKGKLEIEYHINATSFNLPSLSMQVLVENAVKHGISKRPEGGKVIITVDSFKDCFMIVVEDNGVGFDTHAPRSTDRSHIGVDNIRTRLAEIGGHLDIDSTVGMGTTSTVILPKTCSASQN